MPSFLSTLPRISRVLTLSTLALCLSASPAQETSLADSNSSDVQAYTIPQTHVRIVQSSNGHAYRILISAPEPDAKAPKNQKWPVAYLLDADDFFPILTGMHRQQSRTPKAVKQNGISPGYIIGIADLGESRRNFDYTPKAEPGPPETYLDGRPYPERKYGGADAFLDFIEKELKPLIEKEYAVDPSKQAFIGNGFGGLCVIHSLFSRPGQFQTYVASSPSLWWNDQWILKQLPAFLEKLKSNEVKAKLVFNVGDLEQTLTPYETSWVEEERLEHELKISRRRMVDLNRKLATILDPYQNENFQIHFKVLADENHGSVAPVGMTHAMRHVFSITP